MAYSVLMSVYAKENAAYFSDAVESMLHQSCPPDQFVLVCDGPLTPGLDEAIQRFTASRDGGCSAFCVCRKMWGWAAPFRRGFLFAITTWWPEWIRTTWRFPCGWSISWR